MFKYFAYYNSGLFSETTKAQVIEMSLSGKKNITVYAVKPCFISPFLKKHAFNRATNQRKMFPISEEEALKIAEKTEWINVTSESYFDK